MKRLCPYDRLPVLTCASALVLLLMGCGSTARRTHENLNGLLWIQTSGEYAGACRTAYRTAAESLDAALDDARRAAPLEQGADASSLPPAVILDVDETVLDNSRYQARLAASGTSFDPATWNAWCREEGAGAIPGAKEFLVHAVEKGVTVVLLTNRDADLEAATRHNLERLGIPFDPKTVRYMGKTDVSDKGPRRQEVCRSHRVVLMVGDQLGDFVSIEKGTGPGQRREIAEHHNERWGKTWIMLPNPTYGDWERALVPASVTDARGLEIKFETLTR